MSVPQKRTESLRELILKALVGNNDKGSSSYEFDPLMLGSVAELVEECATSEAS